MCYRKRIIFFLSAVLFGILLSSNSVFAGEADSWVYSFSMGAGKNNIPLKNPQSLFVDITTERYYIVDSGNNRLLSFDKNGLPLHSFDANGDFDKPVDMIKGDAETLYVIEKGKGSVTRINLKNREVEPLFLTVANKLLYPQRITKSDSTVLVLDKLSGSIFMISEKFSLVKPIECVDCNEAFVDFEIYEEVIYAITERTGRVFTFSTDGKVRGEILLNPSPQFPVSLTLDKTKNIYVLERHKAQVSVYTPKGKIKYKFLEKGAKAGQLSYPIDMQFDPWGRLCVVDEGNGRVSVYDR
nr:hypothetical protein [Desulfobulbaceae bacterium]